MKVGLWIPELGDLTCRRLLEAIAMPDLAPSRDKVFITFCRKCTNYSVGGLCGSMQVTALCVDTENKKSRYVRRAILVSFGLNF